MDFETIKDTVKYRLKTLNVKHAVLFVLLVFTVLELAMPVVTAWWGGGWGGRGWGWGGGWGGWGRPWWGGWGGWGGGGCGWGGCGWRPWWGGGWW